MKRIISAAVAALMLASAIPAFGAETNTEAAIVAAKTTFDIPAEYTQFSCDISEGVGFGGQTEKEYDLSWYDEDFDKGVRVRLNGDLIPIGYYADYEWHSGLAKLRKEELAKIASDFIAATVPELKDRLVLDYDNSSVRNFMFERHENGIPVEGNYANVNVDDRTGKVVYYDLSWDFESEFSGTDKLGSEEAMKLLAENGFYAQYNVFDDKAIPVYLHDSGIYADAVGGGTFERGYFRYGISNSSADQKLTMDAATAEASGGGGDGGYRLTREELTEVETLSKLIDKAQIMNIVASMPELMIPADCEPTVSYYTIKSKDETKYQVVCSFLKESDDTYENADMRLDAETGELLSFTAYNNELYAGTETPLPDEAVTKIADDFLAKYTELEGYRVAEDTYNGISSTYTRRYERYVGEIPYPADYKNVRVSRRNGKIISYSMNRPKAEIVIPDNMTDKLTAAKNGYEPKLVYAYKDSSEMNEAEGNALIPVLAYKLEVTHDFDCLRCEDGKPIDYSGKEATDKETKADELEHYAWEAFEVLRENGVYIEGSYSLNDNITKGEFVSFVRMLANKDVVPYRYYRIETEDEEALEQPIDREEAARIIAVQLGWEKLIDLDVYSVRFSDESDFTGGKGAAALLQGLAVMEGDGSGAFKPKETMTYGEAYVIGYKLAGLDMDL